MEPHILSLCKNINSYDFYNSFITQCITNTNYDIQEVFKIFSKLYLKNLYSFKELWLKSELTDYHANKIGLSDLDLDIDLIGLDKDDKYYIIHTKYRQRSLNVTTLTNKELNNFKRSITKLNKCKFIIITNADNIKPIDNIDIIKYKDLINIKKSDVTISKYELRNERIKYYEKNNINN